MTTPRTPSKVYEVDGPGSTAIWLDEIVAVLPVEDTDKVVTFQIDLETGRSLIFGSEVPECPEEPVFKRSLFHSQQMKEEYATDKLTYDVQRAEYEEEKQKVIDEFEAVRKKLIAAWKKATK